MVIQETTKVEDNITSTTIAGWIKKVISRDPSISLVAIRICWTEQGYPFIPGVKLGQVTD